MSASSYAFQHYYGIFLVFDGDKIFINWLIYALSLPWITGPNPLVWYISVSYCHLQSSSCSSCVLEARCSHIFSRYLFHVFFGCCLSLMCLYRVSCGARLAMPSSFLLCVCPSLLLCHLPTTAPFVLAGPLVALEHFFPWLFVSDIFPAARVVRKSSVSFCLCCSVVVF